MQGMVENKKTLLKRYK